MLSRPSCTAHGIGMWLGTSVRRVGAPEDLVALVRKALDEPLAAHGFAGGQGGADRAGV